MNRLTQCLILKTRDFGEDSLVVTILSPMLGKQEFVARGAKKIGAKLASSLQPLNLVNILTANAKGPLSTIIEVETINEFLDAKTQRLPLRFSLRALDILETATYPLIDASAIITRAVKIFSLLSKKDALPDIKKLWIYFELCVLDYLGAKPDLKSIGNNTSLNQTARKLEKLIYQALQ